MTVTKELFVYYCRLCHTCWQNNNFDDCPLFEIERITCDENKQDKCYVGWCYECEDY